MAKVAKAKNILFWAVVIGMVVGSFLGLIAVITLGSSAVVLN